MSFFFKKRESSGVFIYEDNKFKVYLKDVGDVSINNIAIALGYHPDQLYSPTIKENKEKLLYVGLEMFTRNPVFIMTHPTTTFITQKSIKHAIGDFSVAKEFDRIRINDELTTGIENKSFPTEFLSKVLNMKDISDNGMFYSEKIDTYLYFTGGLLTDFHFDNGLFPYAQQLSINNPTVFNRIAELAYKYWPENDFQAKKEINIQCEAWANLPGAYGNEFVPLHRTENGGSNLHMIRVCHYNYPIDIDQFKEINHKRYQEFEDENGNQQFINGNFRYTFDKLTGYLDKTCLSEK